MADIDLLAIANENSIYHRELMKDDYVNIKFSHEESMMFAKGTGFTYEDDYYELRENYLPKFNLATGAYEYDMVFKAWYFELEDKIIKLNGNYSAEWTLTDKPSAFFRIIEESAGCVINYDDAIDEVIPFITLTFNGTNCLDALNMVVKALDPDCGYYEWWSGQGELNVGKLGGIDGGATLSLGTNVAGITSQPGSYKKVDKLFAFGGTRNITARYGQSMVSINADHDSQYGSMTGYEDLDHLMFPYMFRSDARVYDVRQLYNNRYEYKPKEAYNHTFAIPLTSSVQFIPSEKGKFKLNTTFPIEITIPMHEEGSSSSEMELTFEIGLGTYERGAVGFVDAMTCRAVCKFDYDEDKHKYLPVPKVVVFEYDTQFDGALYEGETPCLFIHLISRYRGGSYGSTHDDTPPEFTPTIEINAWNEVEVEMEGENYAVALDSNRQYWLNPYFLQESDERATLIDDRFEGVPDNIIKAKCPASWFPLYDDATYQSARLTKRLTLPNGYVGSANGVEGQIIFDDIYPSVTAELGECSIKSIEEEDTNHKKTGVILNYYTFTTEILKNISSNCFTEDTAKISFVIPSGEDDGNTSALAGMEFELKLVKSDDKGTTFCIIPNDNYGLMLPNASQHPVAGDAYTIIGIDVSLYESEDIIGAAQNKLLERANAYLGFLGKDQTVYTCTMMCTADSFPKFGDGVTLTDANGLSTRVIGIQHPLDLPEADYQVICGNSPSYKRLSALEQKTLSLK